MLGRTARRPPSQYESFPVQMTSMGYPSKASRTHTGHTESSERLLADHCGKPGRKDRVSRKDLYLILIVLLCTVAGLLTVFYSRLSVWLGQINQLIVIGFVLAIMSICLEGQVLRAALMHTATRSGPTIQDVDALLRKDAFASEVHLAYRLLLLGLLGLPLLLSVGYKKFVGGGSTLLVNKGDGVFGFSSTPGKQRIGDGLSILSDVYVPFWIDPAVDRTYGFNLYIADDNKTAMIVDSPLPLYLTSLQASLSDGETLSMSATVNATVAEMVNPSNEERNSQDFWSSVNDDFGHPYTVNGGNVRGANNALWAGMQGNFLTNFSVMYFSAWNTTRNESFESEAIRTEQSRRMAKVTWVVSPLNITLTHAEIVANSTLANQSLIQSNAIGLQEMFSNFLGEYDWHNRAGEFDFPYPASTADELSYFQPVNTVPALAAAMAWARITSLDTIDRPQGIQSGEMRALTVYDKAAGDILTVKTVPTLRRQALLAVLLMVNPLISLACILVKAVFLHQSPIGDSFNTVSLFAAAEGGDLGVVRGASLTGSLTRKVGVAFNVVRSRLADTGGVTDRVIMDLDRSGSGRVRNGTIYA